MESPPKYLPLLLRLVQNGHVLPGRVQSVEIRHDLWCGIFKGRSCNCDPEVGTILPLGGG
jgi:hypothetical protein